MAPFDWNDRRRVFVAGLALTLAACSGSGESGAPAAAPVDYVAEAQQITALESEWSAKFGAKDVDWIVNLHAADAKQLPPNAEMVAGAAALRAQWQGMAAAEGLSVAWASSEAHVSTAGDMAWDIGSGTMTTPAGGVPIKYLVVWTKQNGEWKIAVDMFNTNVPAN